MADSDRRYTARARAVSLYRAARTFDAGDALARLHGAVSVRIRRGLVRALDLALRALDLARADLAEVRERLTRGREG